jgi:3-methyladenine DNA glycosylase/8-oxoguanine DNA glycosylase
MSSVIEERVLPRWPYRLPRSSGGDGVVRVRRNVVERLLHVGLAPVLVRSWRTREGYVHVRAESVDPARVEHPVAVAGEPPPGERTPAGEAELAIAVERIRFSLAVEDEMGDFFRAFKADPLLGPGIHHMPWIRPKRRPWPWEALCWAITKQLIESSRAAQIQRRMLRRWGARHLPTDHEAPRRGRDPWPLRDVPSAAVIAGRAPAELASMDLSEGRSLAMVRCAREVAAGRADLADPACEPRLEAIPEIGPWTLQCLGLHGRGEPDSLPAGDLAYVKLVGYLEGLGRRATVGEVEEYFAPYAPFRGLAGIFALVVWHKPMRAGPPAAWRRKSYPLSPVRA